MEKKDCQFGICGVYCGRARVHRRAAGHHFGKQLVAHMKKDKRRAAGFATLGCDGFHMVYVRKDDMERLGFESVKSVEVMHKGKKKGRTLHDTPYVDARSRECKATHTE